MRLKDVVFGIALTTMVAGVANAGPAWFGVTGGAGIPMGDYGDVASTGWNFGATATRQVNETWGFGADLGYHAWGASSDFEAVQPQPGYDYSWRALQATAHTVARFSTQSHMTPYAKFGAGVYNAKLSNSNPGASFDSKSKFGFNFGAGLDFPSSGNRRWGMGAAYHVIPAKDDLGSDLNFFTLGVNLKWGVGQ